MIELILAALAVAATGSAILAIRRQRIKHRESELPPALMPHRDLLKGEIVPRDVIVNLGTDYLVEAVATFHEETKVTLVLAWITDGSQSSFFILDPKDQPRCSMAKAWEEHGIGSSLPNTLQDESQRGLTLHLSRRASVRVRCQGDCDLPKKGVCEVGIYKGPGQRIAVAILEKGFVLCLKGQGVTEAGLTLLPGGSSTAS